MADKLTDKQKRFCDEYLIDLNATQAYQRVYGCKESTARINACKLLTNANINEYIQSKQKKLEEKTQLNAQWVLDNLKEVVERCMQAEPVMVRKGDKMVESGEYTFQSNGANRALELIGKHLGMFTDKVAMDIGNKDDKPFEIKQTVDDEEIEKRLMNLGFCKKDK